MHLRTHMYYLSSVCEKERKDMRGGLEVKVSILHTLARLPITPFKDIQSFALGVRG